MDWRDVRQFPVSNGGWIVSTRALTGRISESSGRAAVDKKLSSWHPFSAILIGTPNGRRLLPALEVPELRESIKATFARKTRLSIFGLIFSLILTSIAWIIRGRSEALQSTVVLVGLTIFTISDYFLVVRHTNRLAERAKFALNVRRYGAYDGFGWLGFMLLAGGLQLIGSSKLGEDNYIKTFGAYFADIHAGELWRLISGPFIHGGFSHWLANSLAVTVVGMILATISRRAGITVFVLGCMAGEISAYFASPYTQMEAYAGVSPGVIAMMGFCGGAALKNSAAFPDKFAFTLISLTLLNIIVAWASTPNACNEGHISGLAVGLACGMFSKLNNTNNRRMSERV